MAIGFAAGYQGGWIDEILNMLTNVFLVDPDPRRPAGHHLLSEGTRRHVRGRVHRCDVMAVGRPGHSSPDVLAAFPRLHRPGQAQRQTELEIIATEIAPNMSSYLFLTFILLFGGAILIAASLDFIGLGPVGGMSLGLMMFNAVLRRALILGLWWWFIPPGIGIMAVVGSLYVMNVGLDEIFNPKLREL